MWQHIMLLVTLIGLPSAPGVLGDPLALMGVEVVGHDGVVDGPIKEEILLSLAGL